MIKAFSTDPDVTVFLISLKVNILNLHSEAVDIDEMSLIYNIKGRWNW
jgi:hypothetical protein